jgi:hydrogenase nickel incorporation protein HypA/HybF
VLEIASRHAQQAQAARVTDIYLVIGRLSSIVDDSIEFYWNIITKNTICEDAKLHFKRLPAELICLDCDFTYQLTDELTSCPDCGSARVRVLSGDEFQLESIEIQK